MNLTIDINLPPEAGGVYLTFPRMSDGEFFEFCRRNRDLRIERTSEGEIIIMPPAGSDTGSRNLEIARQLGNWTEQNGTGIAFDSSTGFTLPNGATRSPDASWVRKSRWEALTEEERERFAPLCPDFVVELMSPSDRQEETRAKLDEYIANGAALGWMIDRKNRQVYVCRPGHPAEVLNNPAEVSGDPVLPGFVLDLRRIL